MTHRYVVIDQRSNWPVMDFPSLSGARYYQTLNPAPTRVQERHTGRIVRESDSR